MGINEKSGLERPQLGQLLDVLIPSDRIKPLWGWHITQLFEYQYKITLSDLGIKTAPQSWCYSKLGGAT